MQLAQIIELSHKYPVLAYDGQCILCNSYVTWLLKRDHAEIFRYVALQHAKDITAALPTDDNDTVVLYKDGQRYTHSDVGLMIARKLPGLWPALSVLLVLPKSLRDIIYNWIARNRYKWFGKSEACLLPDPAKRHLFLSL